jgi:7-carboxy-7-deazaguanine synthase
MGPVRLVVNEIFHSIQGESTHAGRPCAFVRLTGCNLRCGWCDTAYAFHDGQPMSLDEVLDRVQAYDCRLVEVTGGEPLLQPAVVPLMKRMLVEGYEVLLETGGSLSIAEVPPGVKRIVDIKCPGSGEAEKNLWANLSHLRDGDELKFVLAGREDYLWAREQINRRGLERLVPILFSPVHETLDPAEMVRWILEDRLDVRAQVQLHKVLWPAATRGV